MHRTLRLVAAAALALASLPALALKPFNAQYTASYMGLSGNAQMTLASTGNGRWRYALNVTSTGVRLNQTTVFDEAGSQFRPLSGTDSSMLLIRRTATNAIYDWSKAEARWTGDTKEGRSGPVALRAGDMDALLVNLALARDAGSASSLTYNMVDDGRRKTMTYVAAGREAVTVEGKSMQAVKLVQRDGNRQRIVWVVEGVPAPVRILQRKDGQDEIDLRIRSIN